MPASEIKFRVDTPHGEAAVVLGRPRRRSRALLALGHGAGGGVDAVDLMAVTQAALDADVAVARITQPYRLAGKRVPPAPKILDASWVVAVREAQWRAGTELALIVGGRSSGARVACRTAAGLNAVGVVALAFPLHPPGRPQVSRADELDRGQPTLVVNGDRDPFGVPDGGGRVEVVIRPGEGHELRRDPNAVAAAVCTWLEGLL